MHPDFLRNIGIIAHIDAGKTTFTERFLYYANTIRRMGEVHEGSASMDFLPEEQERGITIAAACTAAEWNGYWINLIDTPGHVDFTIEVERSLRVLDGAVGIFCGVSGVEPQSEHVWRQSERFGIPKLAVINKMDREGADYGAVLDAMAEQLGATPLPVTIPFGQGESLRGVLDLVREEVLYFASNTQGREVRREPFDAEASYVAEPFRETLIDILTQEDDALLELCLAGERPSPQQLDAVIRKGTLAGRFTPVFATAAFRNVGIQPVMDGICAYLPSPHEVLASRKEPVALEVTNATDNENTVEEFLTPDPQGPLCAFVFKIILVKGQKIAFARLYSGSVTPGQPVILSRSQQGETVAGVFRVFASSMEPLDRASAGDIVALTGLSHAVTGDTLVGEPPFWVLDPVMVAPPVLALAFEPRDEEEGQRLDAALAQVVEEDPALSVEMRGGERLVAGMGELHLEVVKNRLEREFQLQPRVGNPQVVALETIAKAQNATCEFQRPLGVETHYGNVTLLVEPLVQKNGSVTRDEKPVILFTDGVMGIPAWQKEAVTDGVLSACSAGLQGFAVRSVTITVVALLQGSVPFTELGLHLAAKGAVIQALEQAGTQVLEPFMRLSISVPETHLGATIALLGTCGAKVEAMQDVVGLKQVIALAPMRALFGFATRLRSATQGRAGVAMLFVSFAQTP